MCRRAKEIMNRLLGVRHLVNQACFLTTTPWTADRANEVGTLKRGMHAYTHRRVIVTDLIKLGAYPTK